MKTQTSNSNDVHDQHDARRRKVLALLAASAAAGPMTAVRAADVAARKAPLRIIVATAPGGVPDVLARTIGQQITQNTGRAVVVENRLGAGGAIAANTLQTTSPDGTAVVLVESGAYSMVPHMARISPFAELAPVGVAAVAPIFLCVNAQSGIRTLPEFLALARSQPGMPYGSSGNGSWHHVAMELLKSRARIDLTHVPYKGAGQTVVALIGGEVQVAFLGYGTAIPQAAAGKLKVLAIGTDRRSKLAPEIPTIQEAGGPKSDMRMSALFVFTHPRTPPSEVEFLNRQLAEATSNPAVQAKLAQMGIEGADGKLSSRQFAAMAREEFDFYKGVIKPLSISL